MESYATLDIETVDANGDPLEVTEASKVIDINLKGTLTVSLDILPFGASSHLQDGAVLRLDLHHMKDHKERFPDGSRGSIVLIISTSGYFGGPLVATKVNVRVNAVAPFVTPTSMVGGFAAQWAASRLPSNTTEQVAQVIATIFQDLDRRGACYVTCGPIIREMEATQKALRNQRLGEDVAQLMAGAGSFFASLGGYPLPKLEALQS